MLLSVCAPLWHVHGCDYFLASNLGLANLSLSRGSLSLSDQSFRVWSASGYLLFRSLSASLIVFIASVVPLFGTLGTLWSLGLQCVMIKKKEVLGFVILEVGINLLLSKVLWDIHSDGQSLWISGFTMFTCRDATSNSDCETF